MGFSDFLKPKAPTPSLSYAQAVDLARAQAPVDLARKQAGAAAVAALGGAGTSLGAGITSGTVTTTGSFPHLSGTWVTAPYPTFEDAAVLPVSNIPQFHVIVTYPDIYVYLWIGNEGTRLDIVEQNNTPFEDLPAKYYDLGHIAEYATMIFSDKDVTFTLIEGLKLSDKNRAPVHEEK